MGRRIGSHVGTWKQSRREFTISPTCCSALLLHGEFLLHLYYWTFFWRKNLSVGIEKKWGYTQTLINPYNHSFPLPSFIQIGLLNYAKKSDQKLPAQWNKFEVYGKSHFYRVNIQIMSVYVVTRVMISTTQSVCKVVWRSTDNVQGASWRVPTMPRSTISEGWRHV